MSLINYHLLSGNGVRKFSCFPGIPSSANEVSDWVERLDPPLSTKELGFLFNALLKKGLKGHATSILQVLLSRGDVEPRQAVALRRVLLRVNGSVRRKVERVVGRQSEDGIFRPDESSVAAFAESLNLVPWKGENLLTILGRMLGQLIERIERHSVSSELGNRSADELMHKNKRFAVAVVRRMKRESRGAMKLLELRPSLIAASGDELIVDIFGETLSAISLKGSGSVRDTHLIELPKKGDGMVQEVEDLDDL
jgi:hypothetical protein